LTFYFFSPTERFFSLRSDDLHFLQRSALRGFRAPHLRQTCRKSLLFWAICFFVASAMGKISTWSKGRPSDDDYKVSFGRGRMAPMAPKSLLLKPLGQRFYRVWGGLGARKRDDIEYKFQKSH